jgi:RNA polymerase sigma-70 factor (ECF subfamily)
MAKRPPDSPLGPSPQFATTHWSVVLAARGGETAPAREALETLCAGYWYPLYAYVRRRGLGPEDAQDVTQAFFARMLEKRTLERADPERGKFRSFLLSSMTNFLANERDRSAALKRGGGRTLLSIDFCSGEERYRLEPSDPMTPQRLFERRWALTLLERALERLGDAHAAEGKGDLFARLSPYLTGEAGAAPYAETAEALGMTTDAVKAAVHRLRRRFRTELRAEIAETVSRPEEVDEELGDLFEALES